MRKCAFELIQQSVMGANSVRHRNDLTDDHAIKRVAKKQDFFELALKMTFLNPLDTMAS
jgi:hypothetical protein